MLPRILLLTLLMLVTRWGLSQAQQKQVPAFPLHGLIKIDGILDEEDWKEAIPATSFIQRKPYNGAASSFSSEVRFLYDNSGLYIGAILYDPSPDSILTQLGLRDALNLNADYFMVMISPFNNGVDAFCFKVYASDVQVDYKMPGADPDGYGDASWDAVWLSKAKKNEKGWVVEIKIPYSAIRFPKTAVQAWGINCQRDIRRTRENSTWNFVDSKVTGYVNQAGLLENIRNITPPVRLSISPYVSGYMEKNPENRDLQFSYNYGADLKYGINQSYTLDMTLIPDFGQVPSDDKVYNFTPFEIRYEEKRQFFTEGTEMFDKGGIFYSRRIGDQPVDYDSVRSAKDSSEKITSNPMQTRLINASKVSGRSNRGLGTGFFNAISANTWATIEDTVTGESRRFLTQGFTNYNMIVFDQSLKNNSYLDFLNTNYYIADKGYCANVTGTDFKFANKKYTYALTGNAFISQKYFSHASPEFGYHYDLEFGKISGNFQFSLNQLLETDKYDPNDMGFNDRNNKFNNVAEFSYNIYQPFWKFLNWSNSLSFGYYSLYKDLKFVSFEIHGSSYATNRKYLTMGVEINLVPQPWHDYYEPRVPGYMYIQPSEYSFSGMISSDYRKTLALDMNAGYFMTSENRSWATQISVEPRIRASDRLFFTCQFYYKTHLNNIGYVMDSTDGNGTPVILFGKRNIDEFTTMLRANFMFSSKISLDFRVRHYWLTAQYKEFFTLNEDGTLKSSDYNGNKDINYNLFNVDLAFIWNFAPGSQLSFVWKDAIDAVSNASEENFFSNFQQTLSLPAVNSFSIRLIYYLDAMRFKKSKI